MSPPRMKRRRMADIDPWIQNLIENYGQNPAEKTVKAQVVGVCTLSESQRLAHTDGCMVFLSDGSAHIPASLSAAAWERVQELEDKECFADLLRAVVFVRKYKLEFNMDADLASCQFYLKVDQINSIGFTADLHIPPSCASLPSVREQIKKTWRSFRESSLNSRSSTSGVSLSSLLGAWHDDIIINILNDAMEKISVSATCYPSVVTPTHWHEERLRWKGQEPFVVPVPFLLIPEEPRELMTADPRMHTGADCENENPVACALPQEELYEADTSTPDQMLAVRDLIGDSNDEECTLEHTRQEVLCGTGELSGDGESPWDMFTPVPDLLGLEPNSPTESQSVLREITPMPSATSTQSQSSKLVSEEVSVDGITPGQRLQPTQISPSHGSGGSGKNHCQDHELQNTSPPLFFVQNKVLLAQPTKPNSPTPPTKPKNVHSDGRPFSYLYYSDPKVATALSQYQIPGRFIQWAVHYLGTCNSADVNI